MCSGFLLAVGSSGPPENTALTLDRLGRSVSFQARVTGRDVTRGKPDPQVLPSRPTVSASPPPAAP
jgi:beta-phosphoglucomutase-like phosphatase (HAD superfamily)